MCQNVDGKNVGRDGKMQRSDEIGDTLASLVINICRYEYTVSYDQVPSPDIFGSNIKRFIPQSYSY